MKDENEPEHDDFSSEMSDIVQLEAELLGSSDSETTNTLFDTALRAHIVTRQHGLEEPLLIAGQVYVEAKDYESGANPETAIEFTRAVKAYLANKGIETLEELLNRKGKLLNQHRLVRDRRLE